MSDDRLSTAESIARSVEKISDSRGLAEIGRGVGAGLVAFGVAATIAAIYFGIAFMAKWDGHLFPQTKCFDLKEIHSITYKVNTCTGKIVEYKNPSTPDNIQKVTQPEGPQ